METHSFEFRNELQNEISLKMRGFGWFLAALGAESCAWLGKRMRRTVTCMVVHPSRDQPKHGQRTRHKFEVPVYIRAPFSTPVSFHPLAHTLKMVALVQRPAPTFKADAVTAGLFEEISLEQYKGQWYATRWGYARWRVLTWFVCMKGGPLLLPHVRAISCIYPRS